jgi:hypothetical protein
MLPELTVKLTGCKVKAGATRGAFTVRAAGSLVRVAAAFETTQRYWVPLMPTDDAVMV